MAIRFGVSSTVKNRLPRYSNFWDGTAVFSPFTATGSYDALASYTVPSGGVASITFAGLPTGGQYTHLQLRGSYTNAGLTNLTMTLNGSVNSTYYHYLFGNGSSATAGATTNNIFTIQFGNASNILYGSVTDILDYASTTKNKTIRTLGGADFNGSGGVYLSSNLYSTTSAINSITITGQSHNFAQYSQFALYGIRG